MVKDEEKFMPPKRKRNERYFMMATGSQPIRMRGQGKRCGHMVKGAMAAGVWEIIEEIVEVTEGNLRKHFYGNNLNLQIANRCDGSIITREAFEENKIQYVQV